MVHCKILQRGGIVIQGGNSGSPQNLLSQESTRENRRKSTEAAREGFYSPRGGEEWATHNTRRDTVSVILQGVLGGGWALASVGECQPPPRVSGCPQRLNLAAARSDVHLRQCRKSDVIHLSHCGVTRSDSHLSRGPFTATGYGTLALKHEICRQYAPNQLSVSFNSSSENQNFCYIWMFRVCFHGFLNKNRWQNKNCS